MVDAPARQMIRSDAAYCAAMSAMNDVSEAVTPAR